MRIFLFFITNYRTRMPLILRILSTFYSKNYVASVSKMAVNVGLENIWEEAVVANIEVLSIWFHNMLLH